MGLPFDSYGKGFYINEDNFSLDKNVIEITV